MASIVKLNRSASDDFKRKLQETQRGMDDTNKELHGAEVAARGLRYASLAPDISRVRAKSEDTVKKLREFERAYDIYVDEIEQFDRESARLLRNMPEITQWAQHSGWTADPAIVALNLMEKLVRDGLVKDMAAARAFLLEIKASLAGVVKTCAYCGDPINMSTGNFIYSKEDLSIPGAFPLVFKRFYNSIGVNSGGVMGQNWTHSFNILLEEEEEKVKIVFDDGHAEHYEHNEDGAYKAPTGKFSTLAKIGEEFLLTTVENLNYHFNNEGQLLCIGDLNGNKTSFAYEGGLLAEVGNQSGKLAFAYTDEGLLNEVMDHTGRKVSFTYKNGYLTEVTQPSGAVYKYKYDDNKNLAKIINPQGVAVIFNVYDESGRNVRQHFADGGCQSFIYEDEALSTIATEQNGAQVKYVRDANYRTVRIEYEGSEERFEYNEDDKLTLHQDRNGNIRRYEYDSNGNLTQETDPLGNITGMMYNSLNRLTSILRPDSGQMLFGYDQKGNMIQTVDPLRRTMDYAYTERGQVQQLTMPDGSYSELTYDKRGNITSITDAYGAKTTYEYDELNRVVKNVNGQGHATWFTYNAKGDIIKAINAAGQERVYEYNTVGCVSKIIDFNGGETLYKYNEMNKIDEITDPMGGVTKFRYDLMWNVAAITDPNGHQTRYAYDKLNRLSSTTDAEGNFTRYEHDAAGNVTAVISPNQARTEFTYDALNKVAEVKEADGAATKYEYDAVGNMVKIIDPLGHITKRQYDLAGQLTEITDPLGNATKFSYTLLGQVETVTDAKGGVLRYEYYPGGRLKQVTLPEGEHEVYEYDKNGNIIKVTDALGNETALIYDPLDRIIEIINPLGYSKRFAYDAAGNILEVIDENGNRTQYRYSLLGDIIEVIDALGHSTKYEYDKTRWLSRVEQYRLIDDTLAGIKKVEAQITTYERNKNGEVTTVNSPLDKVMRFKYDSMGNVISKLDEDGLETLYEYNLLNKLTKVAYADGKTVEFSYNPLKQLTEMKDWLGTTAVAVDALGRAEKITDFEGKTVQYQWDELNRKERIVYPDTSEVRYAYNSSGRLSGVIAAAGETRYRYDAMGRISERVLPNDLIAQYEFDQLGRLASLTHSNSGGILDQFKYAYDPAGNITRINKFRAGIEADNGAFDYSYDPLGRLVAASSGGRSKEYIYDSLGNRLGSVENGRALRHEYNALNQLIRTHDGDNVEEYRYDARGNLREVLSNGALKASYVFDATNMMTQAFNADKGKAQYTYDGFRNRVKRLEQFGSPDALMESELHKTDPSNEVRYILDITRPYNNLLMTEGKKNQRYIWGNELLEAEGADPFYYLQDHLGSPIRLVDGKDDSGKNDHSSGEPLAYDEFGVLLVEAQNAENPFGFTGYQRDDISGLYYAQARYYNPMVGRFVSEDSVRNLTDRMPNGREVIDPLSLNLYTYCQNNSIKFTDPSGHDPVPRWAININSGNGTEEDYQKAFEIYESGSASAWAGSAGIQVNMAINTTLNYYCSSNLPLTGAPNSVGKLYNPDGSLKQEREYGPDGQPLRDTDYNHGGQGHTFPHTHDWEDGKRQKGVPSPGTKSGKNPDPQTVPEIEEAAGAALALTGFAAFLDFLSNVLAPAAEVAFDGFFFIIMPTPLLDQFLYPYGSEQYDCMV